MSGFLESNEGKKLESNEGQKLLLSLLDEVNQ